MGDGLPTDQQKARAVQTLARMFVNGGPFEMEADSGAGRMTIRVDRAALLAATHDQGER